MQANSNKSKDDNHSLPKIRSQKRIYTTSDRRITQQDRTLTNRPLSNNGRTKSLRALSSKTIKYQTTTTSLTKTIQQIQKQSFLIDQQTKQIQQEINQLRTNIANSKKQTTNKIQQSAVSFVSKISNRKISLNDNDKVKTQLNHMEKNILNARKHIDHHLQKNRNIQKEIDVYRKQINTLKSINQQLQISFKTTCTQYNQQFELSKRLDSEIAFKNDLTYRKKVQNMHQKAQMIKQYDTILKNLHKQLQTQKPSFQEQQQKSNFYLTDLNPGRQLQRSDYRTQFSDTRPSTSLKKPKISQLRQKLSNYEQQFQQLKQKMGSQNIEQITQKFTQQYKKNFHSYNFINQLYQQYQQENHYQLELISQKNQLLNQIKAKQSDSKLTQVLELQNKIKNFQKKIDNIKKDVNTYNKVAMELKMYLTQYFETAKLQPTQKETILKQLNDNTIQQHLYLIYQQNKQSFTPQYSQGNTFRNVSFSAKQNIDDLFQEARKDTQGNIRDQRILTREEFQKNTVHIRQKKLQNSMAQRLKVISRKDIQRSRTQNSMHSRKTIQKQK